MLHYAIKHWTEDYRADISIEGCCRAGEIAGGCTTGRALTTTKNFTYSTDDSVKGCDGPSYVMSMNCQKLTARECGTAYPPSSSPLKSKIWIPDE